jgi:hypothetical protein
MTANLEALESLLSELSELGATLEEKEITSAPSLTPLVAKAQSLGLHIPSEVSLDDLRSAVEEACERLRTGRTGMETSGAPISTKEILGNAFGIPGEGP